MDESDGITSVQASWRFFESSWLPWQKKLNHEDARNAKHLNGSGRRKCELFFYRIPGLVRVEPLQTLQNLERFLPIVFLINDAVMADDERFHSGDAVLRG